MDSRFIIMPKNIDTSNHSWSAFGNSEMEISAQWLVRFAQERKRGWASFTKKNINDFYQKSLKGEKFFFNLLLEEEYILLEDGIYHFTASFIVKCYKSSPKR